MPLAGMRLLVLSSDPAMAELPTYMCQAYGIPCDVVSFTEARSAVSTANPNVTFTQLIPAQITSLGLTDKQGSPKYYGLVYTHRTLGYLTKDDEGLNDVWVPTAATDDMKGQLQEYTSKYYVRYGPARHIYTAGDYLTVSVGPLRIIYTLVAPAAPGVHHCVCTTRSTG